MVVFATAVSMYSIERTYAYNLQENYLKDLKTCKHVHYALAGNVSVVVAAVVITVGKFLLFFCLFLSRP
jgi:hypothetical protein